MIDTWHYSSAVVRSVSGIALSPLTFKRGARTACGRLLSRVLDRSKRVCAVTTDPRHATCGACLRIAAPDVLAAVKVARAARVALADAREVWQRAHDALEWGRFRKMPQSVQQSFRRAETRARNAGLLAKATLRDAQIAENALRYPNGPEARALRENIPQVARSIAARATEERSK